MKLNRYKGTVVAMLQNHGFISLDTVTRLDGEPHEIETEHDIFIHLDEAPYGLREGMEISFTVSPDGRSEKENAYRADSALLSGVELQFPERVIDHPSIPFTWCFGSDLIEIIKSNPTKTVCLVVGATESSGDDAKKVLQVFIGLDALKYAQGYLDFFAPGDFSVFTYLVLYPGSNEKAVRKMSGDWDSKQFDPVHESGYVELSRYWDLPFLKDSKGVVVSVGMTEISVPDGIFAKPLPGWVKKLFGYYGVPEWRDDCDRRGKQALAVFPGIPWLVVWELLKRSVFFIFGIAYFLVGNKPHHAFQAAFSSELSASKEFMDVPKEKMANYEGWRFLYAPWIIVVFIAFLVMGYIDYKVALQVLGILVASTVFVLSLVYYLARRFDSQDLRKEMSTNRKFEEFGLAVSCGAAPVKRSKSIKLYFSGVKRKVCRNYRK